MIILYLAICDTDQLFLKPRWRDKGWQVSYYDHEIAKHHAKKIRSQVELSKWGPRQHEEREGLKNAAHNC